MEGEERSNTCEHNITHKDEEIWVKPPKSERKHSPQQPRLYCKKCGRLQYTGSATARDLGYFVNILKELKKKVDHLYRRGRAKTKLTQVQMRLIVEDLKNDPEFLDCFSNQQYCQYDFFKECILRHCDIDDDLIDYVYDENR